MVIALLQFEILIPHSQSLKDKRRVVKSLKDRLHREHLVSIAEVGALDHHKAALLGLACVSASAPYAASVLDRVVEKLRALPEGRLGELQRDMIHASATMMTDTHDPELDNDPVWTEDERRDIERSLGLTGDADAETPR